MFLIHTLEETYRMKKSLAKTEEELDEYFFKVHRSFCVNLRHVVQNQKRRGGVENGEEIPISRGMAETIRSGNDTLILDERFLCDCENFLQKWMDNGSRRTRVSSSKRYCDEVESMYTKMRGWRHDYHTIFRPLSSGQKALGQYDEVNDYLRQLTMI